MEIVTEEQLKRHGKPLSNEEKKKEDSFIAEFKKRMQVRFNKYYKPS